MPHATKEARNAYHREYYRRHKTEINRRGVALNKQRRQERYTAIRVLKETPCKNCGGTFPPCVMDFDHRNPATKVADVSQLVKRMVPWDVVLTEVAKCDLVCACCHRLRTYRGSNCYKTRRFEQHKRILDELKSTIPCMDCGKLYQTCQMDFDHTGAKVMNISRLAGGSTTALVEELRKCHLVCANCHRVRGSTGQRPSDAVHGALLVQRFREIEAHLGLPTDRRFVPFPQPGLLGVVPDRILAEQTGVSREMVAWYRRKAGVMLSRDGRRIA